MNTAETHFRNSHKEKAEFRKTLAENPDLLRFHYHKLNLIQKQLYELNMPLREYQTDMMQMPDRKSNV